MKKPVAYSRRLFLSFPRLKLKGRDIACIAMYTECVVCSKMVLSKDEHARSRGPLSNIQYKQSTIERNCKGIYDKSIARRD